MRLRELFTRAIAFLPVPRPMCWNRTWVKWGVARVLERHRGIFIARDLSADERVIGEAEGSCCLGNLQLRRVVRERDRADTVAMALECSLW
jgi:hypothetical protein